MLPGIHFFTNVMTQIPLINLITALYTRLKLIGHLFNEGKAMFFYTVELNFFYWIRTSDSKKYFRAHNGTRPSDPQTHRPFSDTRAKLII